MQPFQVHVPESALADLRARLTATRWPAEVPDAGWERGVPPEYLRELAEYWATEFDWRAVEARINACPQVMHSVDGVDLHVVHVRSPEPDATPLLVTHGWPGSFVEFLDVIGPLTDPRAHGGDPADAFHVVIPSLPGFGYSGPLREHGWTLPRVATLWSGLMADLGYDRYLLQGGDLGTFVNLALAAIDPEHVLGMHLNFLITPPAGPQDVADLGEGDLARLDQLSRFVAERSGYMKLQATTPQTVAYALADSPVGLLAWITEKYRAWADAPKVPEDAVDRDVMLANVTLYWLTATAGSAAHFYFDNADSMPTAPTPPPLPPPLPTPLGVAVFPHDVVRPIRSIAERMFPTIVQWTEFDRGGHFPALEQPERYVQDVRDFRRRLA